MSEQERYGQEPGDPGQPHAPYAPEHPADHQPAQHWDPYSAAAHQGWDRSGQWQAHGYDTGAQQPYADPAGYQQHPYQQQPWGGRHYQQPESQHDQAAQAPPQHPADPYAPYDPYASHDPYGAAPARGPYEDAYAEPTHAEPPYAQPHAQQPPAQPQPEPYAGAAVAPDRAPGPDPGAPAGDGDPEDERFAFVEEGDEQAEDVIDWLKFSESRTERRDERKRQGRNRKVVLVVALVVALVGGIGFAWRAGLLPGTGAAGSGALAGGAQKRDVIVVHLRQVDSTNSSTALIVRNETAGTGTTVLLPNSLSVGTDDGSTTLGRAVVDDGAGPTRDALDTLFGADIQGTWRLDTPYLEILVDAVGGISLDTDAAVTAGGRRLVAAGKGQDLGGQAAVAYATHRGPGEGEGPQLARFGQVLQAVLAKMPSDAATATKIVQSMGAIPDPSLSDGQLGATLGGLADLAKTGHYRTTQLPVQPDGTLGAGATSAVVKDVLGGTVKNADTSGIPTIAVRNGTLDAKALTAAQVQIVNSGYTFVDAGRVPPRSASQVLYADAGEQGTARELAKTLGLPAGDVAKGAGEANADVTVVLGGDYRAPAGGTG